MGRPEKRYTSNDFESMIRSLGRLRTATLVDTTADPALAKRTTDAVDSLIGCLVELRANSTR